MRLHACNKGTLVGTEHRYERFHENELTMSARDWYPSLTNLTRSRRSQELCTSLRVLVERLLIFIHLVSDRNAEFTYPRNALFFVERPQGLTAAVLTSLSISFIQVTCTKTYPLGKTSGVVVRGMPGSSIIMLLMWGALGLASGLWYSVACREMDIVSISLDIL